MEPIKTFLQHFSMKPLVGGLTMGIFISLAALGMWDVLAWAFHHVGLCAK